MSLTLLENFYSRVLIMKKKIGNLLFEHPSSFILYLNFKKFVDTLLWEPSKEFHSSSVGFILLTPKFCRFFADAYTKF